MLTSLSYLKDSSTYSVLSEGDLVRWWPVGGGGEDEFGSVGGWVPNLCRSVCSDAERKEDGSFGDFRMGWLGWNGGEGDLDEAGDGVLGL